MSFIEIIFSYRNCEQEIATYELPDVDDDFLFLGWIFDKFDDTELDKLSELAKMSCCQFVKSKDKVKDFIVQRNGKYYFNPEINEDTDTKYMRSFLDKYITTRKNK